MNVIEGGTTMTDELRKARRRVSALAYPFHVFMDDKFVEVGSPTRWTISDDHLELEFEEHGRLLLAQVFVEIHGGWYHPEDDVDFTTEAEAIEHARKRKPVMIPRPPRRPRRAKRKLRLVQ